MATHVLPHGIRRDVHQRFLHVLQRVEERLAAERAHLAAMVREDTVPDDVRVEDEPEQTGPRRCKLPACGQVLPEVSEARRGRRPEYCSTPHRNLASRQRIAAALRAKILGQQQ